MNILISCAGKQVNLVRSFKRKLLDDEKIIVCDYNEYSPALAEADVAIKSPKFDDPAYTQWILRVCNSNKVSLLISLHEQELLKLEMVRYDLEAIDCELVGTNPEKINAICDKFLLKSFLDSAGLLYPETILLSNYRDEFDKEVVVKPRHGRGSRGVTFLAGNKDVPDFVLGIDNPCDYIVQPLFKGQQYCIDIVNDLKGSYACTLPRRRLQMGAEETEVAETIFDSEIEELSKKLSRVIAHQGSIDVEVFKENGRLYVFDINLRFGGSYAFSHVAGADIPAAILAWARNEEPANDWLKHDCGVVSAKFNSVSIVKEKGSGGEY